MTWIPRTLSPSTEGLIFEPHHGPLVAEGAEQQTGLPPRETVRIHARGLVRGRKGGLSSREVWEVLGRLEALFSPVNDCQ